MATPGNVPATVVPDFIDTIFVQVASGLGPPGAPLTMEKLAELEGVFDVQAWAWCVGPNEPGGGEPEEEAAWHASCARSIGATTFVANMERFYNAGGNQADPRYAYPRRYLAALAWDGPLGLTTEPAFGSDMTAWVNAGAIYLPQAFPLENGYDIDGVIRAAMAWGWPVEQIRPLVQCYTTNGQRPATAPLAYQADSYGVGVTPYVVEQACDDDGLIWLNTMRPQIVRQTPGQQGGDVGETIGPNHGITASMNRLRFLDPKGTKCEQVDGKWEPVESLTIPLDQQGAWDKLERTLKILAADHDA